MLPPRLGSARLVPAPLVVVISAASLVLCGTGPAARARRLAAAWRAQRGRRGRARRYHRLGLGPPAHGRCRAGPARHLPPGRRLSTWRQRVHCPARKPATTLTSTITMSPAPRIATP